MSNYSNTGVFSIPIGVQVSIDYDPIAQTGTWYKLSDHNRQPIGVSYELVEQADRMANGTLRKYVIARKFKITTDWRDFPTLDTNLVDYDFSNPTNTAHAAAWIKAFYEINAFQPVYVKLMYAQEPSSLSSIPAIPSSAYTDSINTTGQIYHSYMTTFTYDVTKRRQGYDYVNLKIEFTEI